MSLTDVTAQITPTSVTSPVSTAVKISQAPPMATLSEPEIAFPAVLKGSQKQRVPPPVPPRGSPKTKRGGGNSQTSSLETKGDYHTLHISVNDIPPQTPITSSDDDFGFYGHDMKFSDTIACRVPPSISDHSIKVTKLVASNSFLDYAEEADSITERCNPGKDLIAQSTMMSKFNIDKTVREHLDTGDYDDASFTDSSSDEIIVVHELGDGNKVVDTLSKHKKLHESSMNKSYESPTESITPPPMESVTPLPKPKSSGFISKLNTLKKIPTIQKDLQFADSEKNPEKSNSKGGIMSGITKKFKQSIKENRGLSRMKSKPRIVIKPYTEEHYNANKDEIVCHKKAKTKIDLFQKQILKVQSESETCSVTSSRDSILSTVHKRDVVNQTKQVFEAHQVNQPPRKEGPVKRPNYGKKYRAPDPVGFKPSTGNVHDKIRKFSVTIVPEPNPPNIITPRKKDEIKQIEQFRTNETKPTEIFRSYDNKIMFKMRKEFEEVL